jgi:hypothetical protein
MSAKPAQTQPTEGTSSAAAPPAARPSAETAAIRPSLERSLVAQLFRPADGSFAPDSGPSLAAPVDQDAAQREFLGHGLQRAFNLDAGRP